MLYLKHALILLLYRLGNNCVNKTVLKRLLSGHIVVSLSITYNLLIRFTCILSKYFIKFLLSFKYIFGNYLYFGSLPPRPA